MARLRGRALRGERCRAGVPHGHWKTTTFTGALRLTGMTAPFVYDGAMNGNVFLAYVEQVLLPTLQAGDVVAWTTCQHTRHPVCGMPSSAPGPSLCSSRPSDFNPCMDGSCESRIQLVPVNRSVAAMYTASDVQRDCCAP